MNTIKFQKFDSLVEELAYTKKTRMPNPTLISGFEDIIAHIKQQEQRIMNLEQNEKVREARVQELYLENKKLKEENEELDNEKENLEEHLRDLQYDHDELEEENEKLEEENKKFKADEQMKLSAVEAMKIGMEHKWDQKEKEWVSEEEYEERYGEENDPEQYGEAMLKSGFKNKQEYQEWLKNTPKEGIDY